MAATLTHNERQGERHEFSLEIDTSTSASWARTWLDRAIEWAEIPEWLLGYDGIYDMANFSADSLAGDIPWADREDGSVTRSGVCHAIENDSRLDEINALFMAKTGQPIWERGWADQDDAEASA